MSRRTAGLLAGLFACCSSAFAAPATAPAKFMRFVETPDHSQLQTSVVHYENAAGVKVDLIGAVHIADPAYYAGLNDRFKQYDALLYEMVKPRGMEGVDLTKRTGKSASWISMVQRFMKDQLELDFQLDRVDYTPANFVHADMDAETFAEEQEARGESMLSMMFESMMREMNRAANDARQNANADIGIMDLINALQSPDRGRQLKLVLGRQFGDIDDALNAMGGSKGSVILDERNKHALQVLGQQVEAGKKHLAVFYGAGHMKGMNETLTTLMGFKQVGDPEWLVAWDIDLRPRGAATPLEPGGEKSTPTTHPAAVPVLPEPAGAAR